MIMSHRPQALLPQSHPVSRYDNFHFDRFGVRVPTIIVSSYVKPGTVFRSPSDTPYDHTSILATLRDWQKLDDGFLPSPRIQHAPTLDQVLTLSHAERNVEWPDISATCQVNSDDESLDLPLGEIQLSLITGMMAQKKGLQHIGVEAVKQLRSKLKTYEDAIEFMKGHL